MTVIVFGQSRRRRKGLREAIKFYRTRFADNAHGRVLRELERTDLSPRYAAFLKDVEKALRPRPKGLIERLGLRRR